MGEDTELSSAGSTHGSVAAVRPHEGKAGEKEDMLRRTSRDSWLTSLGLYHILHLLTVLQHKGNKNFAALLAKIENHWIGAQEWKERSIFKSDICKYFSC